MTSSVFSVFVVTTQLQCIMRLAGAVVDLIDVQAASVLVCLEDGWDATAQVGLAIFLFIFFCILSVHVFCLFACLLLGVMVCWSLWLLVLTHVCLGYCMLSSLMQLHCIISVHSVGIWACELDMLCRYVLESSALRTFVSFNVLRSIIVVVNSILFGSLSFCVLTEAVHVNVYSLLLLGRCRPWLRYVWTRTIVQWMALKYWSRRSGWRLAIDSLAVVNTWMLAAVMTSPQYFYSFWMQCTRLDAWCDLLKSILLEGLFQRPSVCLCNFSGSTCLLTVSCGWALAKWNLQARFQPNSLHVLCRDSAPSDC